jgi:hypothetical protein
MINHASNKRASIVHSAFRLYLAIASSLLFIIGVVSDSTPSIFLPFIVGTAAVWYTIVLGNNWSLLAPSRYVDFLSIKIILSTIIYVVFWSKPLTAMGILTIETQEHDLALQDSMFYQYHALNVSQLEFSEWISASRVTWQSEGVVCYIAIINRLFGVDLYNVVIVNILLGYLSVLQLCKIRFFVNFPKSHYVLLWPHNLYYDVPPGKEALTNFFLFSTIAVAYKIFLVESRLKIIDVFSLIFSMLFLSVIRVNVTVLVILAIIVSVAFTRRRMLQPAIGLFVVLTLIYLLVGDMIGVYLTRSIETGLTSTNYIAQESGGVKEIIAKNLSSLPFVIKLLLAPLYVLIWLLSPLPFLGVDRIHQAFVVGDSYAQFRLGPYFFRVLGSIWIAKQIIKINVWKSVGSSIKNCDHYKFIFITGAFLTVVVAITSLVEGARYRVVVEPIIFLLLTTVHQRSGYFR